MSHPGGPRTASCEIVPTLAVLVAQADALWRDGKLAQARRAWEDLVQRSQDKVDRGTEGIARAMLARCLIRLREVDAAREQLARAARVADPRYVDAYARYRAALVRLAIEDGPAEVARREQVEYLRWAEEERRGAEILDACLLLSSASSPGERAEWLERGIAQVPDQETSPTADLGRAWTELGAALDQLGEPDRALDAYQHALRWATHHGRIRDAVAAGWAVGVVACRTEDWPLARTTLEDALRTGESRSDCEDLVALALADLAAVYEAAGDVVEARRLMIRALARGREVQLATEWPERWVGMLDQARRLELD